MAPRMYRYFLHVARQTGANPPEARSTPRQNWLRGRSWGTHTVMGPASRSLAVANLFESATAPQLSATVVRLYPSQFDRRGLSNAFFAPNVTGQWWPVLLDWQTDQACARSSSRTGGCGDGGRASRCAWLQGTARPQVCQARLLRLICTPPEASTILALADFLFRIGMPPVYERVRACITSKMRVLFVIIR
jgi:hypothetical protein